MSLPTEDEIIAAIEAEYILSMQDAELRTIMAARGLDIAAAWRASMLRAVACHFHDIRDTDALNAEYSALMAAHIQALGELAKSERQIAAAANRRIALIGRLHSAAFP